MLNGFSTYLKSKGHRPYSVGKRQRVAGHYLQWLEKQGIEDTQATYNDLLAYIKHLQKRGISQRTVQHYMGTVKHYYDYLIDKGAVESPDGSGSPLRSDNPATDIKIQGIKRKTLYPILTAHQLHNIYHSYREDTNKGSRNKAILGLLIYQGLKTEELGRLETTDIKPREGKVTVPGSRKSNGREIQLEAHQVIDLYDYLFKARNEILQQGGKTKTDPSTNKLFIGPGGSTTIGNQVNPLAAVLRKKHPELESIRQIRASVITKWLKQHNLRETQYLAGHRYISTTESYRQNDMEGLLEAIVKYHPF